MYMCNQYFIFSSTNGQCLETLLRGRKGNPFTIIRRLHAIEFQSLVLREKFPLQQFELRYYYTLKIESFSPSFLPAPLQALVACQQGSSFFQNLSNIMDCNSLSGMWLKHVRSAIWQINTAPVLCNCKIFWQNVKDHENENSIVHMCDLIPHLLSSFCLMAHSFQAFS